jgi:hypothetical protein
MLTTKKKIDMWISYQLVISNWINSYLVLGNYFGY